MWCRHKCIRFLCHEIALNNRPQRLLNRSIYVHDNNDSNGIPSQDDYVRSEEVHFAVSSIELENVLKANNCNFEDGYTCISAQCKNCSGKQGQVFINKITGFCLCMDCQQVGEWVDFTSKIIPVRDSDAHVKSKKVPIKLETLDDFEKKWKHLKETLRPIASLSDSEFEKIISSFKLKVTHERRILNDLDVVYDQKLKILHFPLSNGENRVVGVKELSLNGQENCIPIKKCPGFLRFVPSKTLKNSGNVILVLSVKDLLALSTVKHNYHVICLPHGALALPQEILPLLEHYSKVILWFGTDELSAARSFARKLNEKRCYLVSVSKPTLFITGENEADVLNTLRTAHPMTNKFVITFANLREEVLLGITNTDKSQGVKWTRYPGLNEILRGHRRGELTILTGPTGCGKTTFLSEYSLDLAMQGVSTLWGSFEIRNQRLAATMLQQFAMKPVGDILKDFDTWANNFEKLPIYFLKFHGQQSIELVLKVVEQATYVHDIRHLVIDNLQFMLGLSAAEERYMDRFYKQDKVVAAFRSFATLHDCHVTLIIHPRKEKDTDDLSISSLFGTAKASQEADNIMIIQKKMLESLRIKKYLQIMKNRFSGDLGVMPLNFTKSALSFGVKNQKDKSSTNSHSHMDNSHN